MIRHKISLFTLMISLLMISLVSCKEEVKDFSFSYSAESVDNYRYFISFESDKSFKIEEINYFMDNHARRRSPRITEGEMTDDELATMKKLLTNADLFKLDDSYGFDKEEDDLGYIIYQIYFRNKDKEKYISIRANSESLFPQSFLSLISYANKFGEEHKQ